MEILVVIIVGMCLTAAACVWLIQKALRIDERLALLKSILRELQRLTREAE